MNSLSNRRPVYLRSLGEPTLSDESSNENQFEEGVTEQELMNDPELYERKDSSKSNSDKQENHHHHHHHKKPNYFNDVIIDNEVVLSKLRLEGTHSTPGHIAPSPTKKRIDLHHNQHEMIMQHRELSEYCEQIDTKADPVRVTQRVELIRLNSYDNVPQPEERQRNLEGELGSPTKRRNGDYTPIRPTVKPSNSSLAVTKTKKESRD